jgi:hypothetical protein
VWQQVEETGCERPALHHAQHICARHGIRGEPPMLINALKELRLLFIPDACGF